MSRDIYIDPTLGDLFLENGQLRLTNTQEEATRQYTQQFLAGFRGELFWDLDFGVPWLKNDNNPVQILGKQSDKRFVDVQIKEAILGREGIVQITSYNSVWDRANRTLTVSFTAETVSGEPISVEEIEVIV